LRKVETLFFLPAAGYRETDGVLMAPGFHGYYWSSSERASDNGFVLNSGSGGSAIQWSDTKTYGFTIRCVRRNQLHGKLFSCLLLASPIPAMARMWAGMAKAIIGHRLTLTICVSSMVLAALVIPLVCLAVSLFVA